ncbi:MAG: carboxypeptidase-like regulatory domain-containing protein, partial [Bryobacteraceae bacterium]
MNCAKYLSRAAFTLVCLFSLASLLFAQSDRGAISGRVFDASGAAIPGAKVIITNTSNNSTFTSESNESGAFSAPSLPVGNYSIRVEHEGFKPAVLSGLTVNASSSVRGDITMEIGTSVQAVEINANAILLQSDSAKSSTTITQKLVDQLPLVVGGALRSPFDLAVLTPEAKNFGGDRFSIGGGQNSSYGVTLDGVSAATTRALQTSWIAYNAPSLEAVTEFTVDTNGFKAEYGHAAGGSMAFASKSGT